MPEYMYDKDGRPVLIDWSESGWVVFEVMFWFFYLILYVPLRWLWDLIFRRRR